MRRCLKIAVVLAGLAITPAWAADHSGVKLDFERYSIQDKQCNRQPVARFRCLQLPDDSKNKRSRRYNFITDTGSNYDLGLQDDPAKGKVLMLQLKPYDDGCVKRTPECSEHKKDKVEFTPVHPDDDNAPDVRDGKPYFFSFDFKLDRNYEVGSGMVLHMQARQEMPRHSPIFAMNVKPLDDRKVDPATAPVDLEFLVRDDSNVAAKMAKNLANRQPGEELSFSSVGRAIHTLRVERDRWYTVTLQMLPAYIGSGNEGRIVMWLDGEQKFDYRGDWGYKPLLEKRTSKIALALDVYRAPFQKSTQKIYFDNVSYSSSYDDVIVKGH